MAIIKSVGIHQPHFLPWPPYLVKIIRSEEFVFLDDVQYRRHYYQNRTKIIGSDEKKRWIIIPVHGSQHKNINEIRIADKDYLGKLKKQLHYNYQKYPYFDEVWADMEHYFFFKPV